MQVVLLGSKPQTAEALEWLLHQPQIQVQAVVLPEKLYSSPAACMAFRQGVPLLSYQELEKKMENKAISCDLLLSYLYGNKITEPVLSEPKYGCINFHPAPLPDYRGLAGCSMAILDKLQQWGCTAHYIDEQFDTGKIIRVFRFSFDHRFETAFSLKQKTLSFLFGLLQSVVADVMKQGWLPSEPQNNEQSIYVGRKQMLEKMRIDPSVDDIDNKIRAFWYPPYPGAYVEIQQKRYTLCNEWILNQLAKFYSE